MPATLLGAEIIDYEKNKFKVLDYYSLEAYSGATSGKWDHGQFYGTATTLDIGVRATIEMFNYFGGFDFNFSSVTVEPDSPSDLYFQSSSHGGTGYKFAIIFGRQLFNKSLRLWLGYYFLNRLHIQDTSFTETVYDIDGVTLISQDSYTKELMFNGRGYKLGASYNFILNFYINLEFSQLTFKKELTIPITNFTYTISNDLPKALDYSMFLLSISYVL